MLLSSSLLSHSLTNMKNCNKNDNNKPLTTGQKVVASILLTLATIVFILELLVLVYAIQIAFATTQPGKERILHIIFAIFATGPYVLLNLFFSSSAKAYLTSGMSCGC